MLVFLVAAVLHVNAMDYETSRREALFLTDKMAYELNLNEVQYEQAYQINFDYLMGLGSPADAYGVYLSRRNMDFQYILQDWQYSLFTAADYFFRPVTWRLGSWFFPIYSFYDTARFFFSKPSCWLSYRGGHSWGHNGGNSWFRGRRAEWNGGFRGGNEFRGGNVQRGGVGYHIGGQRMGNSGGGMQGGRQGNGRGYTIGEPNRGAGTSMGGFNRGNENRSNEIRNNENRSGGYRTGNSGTVNNGSAGMVGGRQSSTRSTVQGTIGGGRSGNMGGSTSRGMSGGGTSRGGRSGNMGGGHSGGGRR